MKVFVDGKTVDQVCRLVEDVFEGKLRAFRTAELLGAERDDRDPLDPDFLEELEAGQRAEFHEQLVEIRIALEAAGLPTTRPPAVH
jgi:hypothetical protein